MKWLVFFNYIYENLDSTLFQEGIEIPRIIVEMTINEYGTLEKVKYLRKINIKGSGLGYENEILRVLTKMPIWIPALENEVPIKNIFILPIRFDKFFRKKYLESSN